MEPGLRLYVDGYCCASKNGLFAVSKSSPVLSYQVATTERSFQIDVYCFAIITVKVKISIDGRHIGGDRF